MSPVRARVLQIRRTVAAVAVTVFIALFSAIYVQMASGDDPALGTGTTAAATSSSTPQQQPSSVTTRQS
jgi:hypothetical protein